MDKPTVLFVDDEKKILSALKRSLIKEPYQQLFADNAADALKIIEDQQIQVIVCDMKMPRMDGLQLLRKVRDKSPQTVRLILSGFTDVEQLIGCINNGEIYRYLSKSYNLDDFKQSIAEAIDHYQEENSQQAEFKKLQDRYQAIEETLRKHQSATDELLRLSSIDILTTMPNQQSFKETINHEWALARSKRQPLSLLMVNINYLKNSSADNDQHDFETCLKKVAWSLRKTVRRPDDHIARFDETLFAILLPGTNNLGAVKIVERILSKINLIEHENKTSADTDTIDVNIGLVCKKPALENIPLEHFLNTASTALYAAQKSGRNCWIDMSEQLETSSH